MRICPNCGTNNRDESKFCAGCGQALTAAQPDVQPAAQANAQPQWNAPQPAPQWNEAQPASQWSVSQPSAPAPGGAAVSPRGGQQQTAYPAQGVPQWPGDRSGPQAGAQQPYPAPGQPYYGNQPAPGYGQQFPVTAPPAQQKPKKKNKALLIIAPILAVVLLIGGILTAVLVINRDPRDSDFEFTGYFLEYEYGSTSYYLVVKNNFKKTVEIKGEITAKDAEGNAITTKDVWIYAIGPGQTSIDWIYFDEVKNIGSVDFSLTYETDTGSEDVLEYLDVTDSTHGDDVSVSVKNNCTAPAEYVWGYVLFFDTAGNLVDGDQNSFQDDNNQIKPGSTITCEFSSYKDYYRYEIYLSGEHK